MSATAQPCADRDHRPGRERQHRRHQRRQQEDALVGAGRNDRLLEDEFQQVGEGLQQAPRADHVGAAAQLHRRPDLAVGIEDVGDEDQQDDDQHDRLQQDDQGRQDVDVEEAVHLGSYSAACLKPDLRQRRAFGHDGGGARDRVGQVEILDRRRERGLAELAAERRQPARHRPRSAGRDLVDRAQDADSRA